MPDEKHVHVYCDRRASFAEISELLAKRVIDLSQAEGEVISVSHSYDPGDPDGTPYSLIVVGASAVEVDQPGVDVRKLVDPPKESGSNPPNT